MSYRIKNSNVMKITKMNITGNVVPVSWFNHLTFKKSGKPHLPAIMILSDILYWYKALEKRDEATGMVIEYRQKFKSDMLQKQYKLWMRMFGFGYDQTKDAVKYLIKKDLINREFRNIKTKQGEVLWNRMFVEPIPEEIEKITYHHFNNNNGTEDQNREGGGLIHGGCLEAGISEDQNRKGGVLIHGAPCINPQNTEITTKNTTDNNKNTFFQIFKEIFGYNPNKIQKKRLLSYDIEKVFLEKIIKKIGLGGHNETFLFNKLDELNNKNIKKERDLHKKDIEQLYKKGYR